MKNSEKQESGQFIRKEGKSKKYLILNSNFQLLNSKSGITLIALVVTIIILLILAGVTINLVLSDGGIFKAAQDAKNAWEEGAQNDLDSINSLLGEMNQYLNGTGSSTGGTVDGVKVLKNGSWDGKVNSPKIDGTGLIPVYYGENGQVIELTNNSTQEQWNNWYDYSTEKKQWANAITKDSSGNITGYFVWIPRYAYKITSGLYTANTGTIEIKFLQGTNNIDSEGKTISTTYPTVSGNAMTDYVVHPAFETDITNGGWSSDLPGFWVAKYPAGFQKNTITDTNGTLSTTISNSSDTVVNSTKNYTSYHASYAVNALEQDLTQLPIMSLPVFTPLTYAYNNISIADSYALAQEVASTTSFYGLSNVDSHQMKNSEWGAVVYLTKSSYGIEEEPNINNYYTNNTAGGYFKTAVTGVYASGTTPAATQTLENAYYTETGVKGSSTGNIYGVYDLNGCVWERTSGFISNGNANLLAYGKGILDTTGVKYDETAKTVEKGTGSSNKYITIYPYDTANDGNLNNWSKYYESKEARFGDAVLETSAGNVNGTSGWNSDYSDFPYTTRPFFVRGGAYTEGEHSGIFTSGSGSCSGNRNDGFRACLAF